MDAGHEVAPDPSGDARGVHRELGDLGAQDMGRSGHLDFQPVELGLERNDAVPPRVRHLTPARDLVPPRRFLACDRPSRPYGGHDHKHQDASLKH
jgi:hypothetical protein